jgi:hypothetical protein
MKPQMNIEQLSVEQRQVVTWLSERGAISPSEWLAQTSHAPKEAWEMLNQLAEWGLIIMRSDPDSPDGMLIVASPTATQTKRA